MDALTAFVTITSAVAGGLLVYFGGLRQLQVQAIQHQSNLARSIAAEIDTYLEIVKRRKHIQYAEGILRDLEKGVDQNLPRLALPDETALGQFPIFTALLSRVGELDDLAGDVSRFYSLAAAVRTTAISAARGEYDHLTQADKIQLLRSELEIWQDLEQLGTDLVPKLRELPRSRAAA